MCGGRGTRLDRGEKPLFEVGGDPMVDRVLAALEGSRIDRVHAVTSPHVPETAAHLDGRVPHIEAAGEGYVADLADALESVGEPVLTVVSDLPLLSASVVDRTLSAHDGGSLTVCVPTALKRALGVSADSTRKRDGRRLSPAGLNVVSGDERVRVSYDARLAVNVNRPADAEVAEVLADGP
ncbi:cobalamin biosynthesis protein CobY [Halobacteriales archaeon QS_9_68_42]|nr:MAG: cobalamin biosynthesis protein CobY [Halobacteriales archaeon QS_1_68_44]PSQ44291.1 MAG: cobalamin biosynthesis protein CobY [Halobacteriales archaeon QS_9_68_42]